MLYKVIAVCFVATGVIASSASPVTLEPQLEADDEEGARAKLDTWLESTGYRLDPNNAPQFIPLNEDGSTLASEHTAPTLDSAVVDQLRIELAEKSDALDRANARLGDVNEAASREIGHRDAKIAELKQQVEGVMSTNAKIGADLEARDTEIAGLKQQVAKLTADLETATAPASKPDGETTQG